MLAESFAVIGEHHHRGFVGKPAACSASDLPDMLVSELHLGVVAILDELEAFADGNRMIHVRAVRAEKVRPQHERWRCVRSPLGLSAQRHEARGDELSDARLGDVGVGVVKVARPVVAILSRSRARARSWVEVKVRKDPMVR